MAISVIDKDNLTISLLATVGMQFVFFLIAATLKIDTLTDLAGGSNFLLVALLTFFLARTYAGRQILITVVVAVWAVRLSGFLFFRILMMGKDDRFDNMRDKPLQFAIFWILQAVWVFVVSLPVILINSPVLGGQQDLWTARDIAGFIIIVFGILIEATADAIKYRYRCNPKNNGHWCDASLWSWSRHPNYFGELCMWWGVFTVSASALKGWRLVSVLSPLLISWLLLFLSGIPLLEQAAEKKHGNNPEYRKYKDATSPLIPLPPIVYRNCPFWVKLALFEWYTGTWCVGANACDGANGCDGANASDAPQPATAS